MPSEKLVMIAMNAALEDVYKKVFADSYQHGAPLSRGARKRRTDSEKEEAWHEIGGGKIADSELLDSMDGSKATHSSTKSMLSQQSSRGAPPSSEIETSTLYRVPNLRFFKYPINQDQGRGFKA
ncbi:hypothetical protein WN944_023858 [Citrus x changshan-huyou]|uniref:Uncharacterized protein n=1 Tax=Citrus x changshan-huyou TaxID=2935761 RepID=A0AAP0QA41_9ROSI